ncbi:MAG: hypothetical protein JRI97_00140 [Deltaproteobacteria bacterium]|nr:hypothetical protein [Deltaproteobacteria bacterium]
MQALRNHFPPFLLCLLALCVLAVSGCSVINSGQKEEPAVPAAPPEPAFKVSGDFSDIRLPRQLNQNQDESFVVRAGGEITGILVYSGGIRPEEAVSFFLDNMPADAWNLVSILKSARTMMLFKKENRYCVIQVDSTFLGKTEAIVWVAPANAKAGEGNEPKTFE